MTDKKLTEAILLAVAILVMFCLLTQVHAYKQIEALKKEQESIQRDQRYLQQVYTGLTVGRVIDKQEKNGQHTLTIAGYGNFLVSETTYEEVVLGADMPDEIKERVEVKKGVGG